MAAVSTSPIDGRFVPLTYGHDIFKTRANDYIPLPKGTQLVIERTVTL